MKTIRQQMNKTKTNRVFSVRDEALRCRDEAAEALHCRDEALSKQNNSIQQTKSRSKRKTRHTKSKSREPDFKF